MESGGKHFNDWPEPAGAKQSLERGPRQEEERDRSLEMDDFLTAPTSLLEAYTTKAPAETLCKKGPPGLFTWPPPK